MFGVSSGDKHCIAMREQNAKRAVLLRSGAGEFVPLNGSREEREDSREFHMRRAAQIGVPAQCIGGACVIIGWRSPLPRTFRGQKYLRSGNSQYWLHWRKAKRSVRLGRAVVMVRRQYGHETH